MPHIVSVVNLKGGVGKTAIAVNFAAYCGMNKKKTLLVDLDPQTNATFSCITVEAWDKHAAKKGTVADLLEARGKSNAEGTRRDVHSVIMKDVFENMDLIPSHLDLFTVDLDLASATARERKLRKALQPIQNDYEIIVCDCPPNLTIPTQNALAFSSHHVVPISPDYLSSLGVGLLLTRVKKLCDDLEHDLEHLGIVISRVGRPATHRETTVAALRATFKGLVLDTELKERAAVAESAEKNRPIYQMGNHDADREFRQMSSELLKRLKGTK